MGWKWGCQLFSCPCSQNVTHCRKEICSTCHTAFNVRWPDMLQSLRIDCLPMLNKPHPYSPKNTRTLTRDAQIQTFPIPFRPFLLGIPRIHSTRSLRFFGAAVGSTSSSLCLHYACKRSHPFGEDSGFVSHSEKQRSGQYCGLQGLLWNIGMCFFFSLPCRLLQCVEN